MSKTKRYKVIEEYPRYYIAVDEFNIKECFQKSLYIPNKEGYIYKELPKNTDGPKPPKSICEKINLPGLRK